MNTYYAERAAALRDELNRTRVQLRRHEVAYFNMRLLAIAGWMAMIGMYVLGALK